MLDKSILIGNTLGMNIKEFFDKKIGTQTEVAKKIGRSQGYVSRMVSGDKRIPAELVKALVAATGGHCTAAELRPDLYGDDQT